MISRSRCWALGCILCIVIILGHNFRSEVTAVRDVTTDGGTNDAEYSRTKIFPSDWAISKEAIDALRLQERRISERHVHFSTAVLYDLRTHLGPRPVKYLEIGSYTGVSASLLLSHPFQTFVHAVDPCILGTVHFRGVDNQEATIRRNLGGIAPMKGCKVRSLWTLHVGFSPGAIPTDQMFDIVFIDGDHSTQGVWGDYRATLNLLRPGGFMVFDDYRDFRYSPEVRPAVDEIANATSLIPIGSPPNVHGFNPELNLDTINEFIFQKKGSSDPIPVKNMMEASPNLCITVATHRRADGSSPRLLQNLWEMLQRQTYKNWQLYLTGDFYDDEAEFKNMSFMNDARVKAFNLEAPGERGRLSGGDLWRNGGVKAFNNAIERLIADGNEWSVHLDDDDYWDSDHLANILSGIRTGATLVFTDSQFHVGWLPPEAKLRQLQIRHDVFPRPCAVTHSSVAYNMRLLKSRYAESALPADAYLWARIVYDDNFFPAYVPVPSLHYTKGGEPTIVRRSTLNLPLPDGWYGEKDTLGAQYHTLATKDFPQNLSEYCRYVVGPQTGVQHFTPVEDHQRPYHIAVVHAFRHLQVWERV